MVRKPKQAPAWRLLCFRLIVFHVVTAGLDPAVHRVSEDGLPDQVRQ
jgi:hypothetical protein